MSGHTSELYRNVLQAVRALSVSPADRKALFVLSDGLADDQAYFHEDVIGAAQAGGVIIVGLGYARSEHDSVALQAVRRLAEDSGGIYLAAGENVDLPPGFAEDVYRILGNGGGFTFDLSPAVEQGLSGTRSLLVQLTLENGSASASIPVHIPSSLPPSPNVTTVVEKKQVPTPAPAGVLVKPDNLFLWIAVGLLAMVVIVMLFVLVFLLRRNTPAGTTIEQTAEPKSEESEGNREPEITVAYLEPLDDVGTAYTINCATYRIGRHSSNDLPVPDSSVSRQHAEIRRRGGGRFSITDLDSMNGVFVNNKPRKHADLSDKDTIELGYVAFRFAFQTTRDLATDSTVIMTEAPTEFDFDISLDDDDEEKIA